MADGGGLRAIDASDFMALEAVSDAGAAPMLQWVKIEDLVVDEAYQRPIYGAGRTNVRRIAGEFRWSKFAPVIVAPIPGGKFAVIDGQHRATAARLRGIAEIPAQVIIADQAEQAAAFKSINGQVTRMHSLALHHAALAAGDKAALEIADVTTAAGVTLLRYPRTVDWLKAGETLALGSIADSLRLYGRDVAIVALSCITQTANNKPGGLSASAIRALSAVIAGNAAWREGGPELLAAVERVNIGAELEEAQLTRRQKGTAVWEVLADRLRAKLIGIVPATPGAIDGDEADDEPAGRGVDPSKADLRHLTHIAQANQGRGFPAPRP